MQTSSCKISPWAKNPLPPGKKSPRAKSLLCKTLSEQTPPMQTPLQNHPMQKIPCAKTLPCTKPSHAKHSSVQPSRAEPPSHKPLMKKTSFKTPFQTHTKPPVPVHHLPPSLQHIPTPCTIPPNCWHPYWAAARVGAGFHQFSLFRTKACWNPFHNLRS